MSELTAQILTSASVATIVSSIMVVVNSIFERRARLKEELLKEAISVAKYKTEIVIKAAERGNSSTYLIDPAYIAIDYYKLLKCIHDKGPLSLEDIKDHENSSLSKAYRKYMEK